MNTTPSLDLFGEVPAAEPAPVTDSVARLKVKKTAQGKLSPAQQRFNKLLARVDNLGRQMQDIEQLAASVRGPHLAQLSELERRIAQTQAQMLLYLHERLQRKGLSAAQQKSVRGLVQSLLLVVQQEMDEAQWTALHAQYFPPEAQAQQAQELQDAKQQVLNAMEQFLGRPLDLDGVDDLDSPQDLLEAVMRQVQADREAEQARQAERKAKRPPTEKQRKAEQHALDAKAAMRAIYRQLASALHPDRETDPAERQRKSALMAQANAANERGDLVTLLRLQLQAEQVDEAHIARMADEKLAALSLLLKEQVAVLEYEVAEAEMRLSDELGVMVTATTKAPVLAAHLQQLQHEMAHTAQTMQQDLERVRDDAELKRWLREQAALARQQEREEAMLMRFGGLY
ncbi:MULTISPECIES: hypothetical protein [unclassified Acidovorax]|uniref:hypothetical protein n=1 Tax=unclassified Acidovorax TaxID=2684926 RepID=UPI000B3FC80F|nr:MULTISPECIES: hypothetical protein [unclassified Acidovorax]MBP3979737.1 hypothetical protein [Acidovorax sp. JG5]